MTTMVWWGWRRRWPLWSVGATGVGGPCLRSQWCPPPGLVTGWSLAFLAFERYIVICKPFGNFRFTSKHALMVVAATWVIGIGVSIPPFFGWSRWGGTVGGWAGCWASPGVGVGDMRVPGGCRATQQCHRGALGVPGGCQEGAEPPSSTTEVPWGAIGVPQLCHRGAMGLPQGYRAIWQCHEGIMGCLRGAMGVPGDTQQWHGVPRESHRAWSSPSACHRGATGVPQGMEQPRSATGVPRRCRRATPAMPHVAEQDVSTCAPQVRA